MLGKGIMREGREKVQKPYETIPMKLFHFHAKGFSRFACQFVYTTICLSPTGFILLYSRVWFLFKLSVSAYDG